LLREDRRVHLCGGYRIGGRSRRRSRCGQR
jgi:hypothetical protein